MDRAERQRVPGANAAQDATSEARPGFDTRLERLESIVTDLEDGDLDLERCLERYKEGVALLRGCREELAGFRRQVEELTAEAEGGVQPFDGDPDVAVRP